ncbi:hypothetical protein BLA29_008715 [Euroglyphus maynei]|uniref:Uncharacterized protein n=1 Tax=Euroglyphus maynei TaxID=6958 RepID=A0A1Y3BQR4_EURMA|nr:hypothetical protein BLA29_008715 [Euroglyphus maynei]
MKHKNGETGNWPFFDSMYRMYKSITRSIDETEKSIENTIKSNFDSNKIAYSTDSSTDHEHSPSTSNDAFDDNSPSMVIHPNKRRKNDPVTELVDSVINHFKERGRIPATNDNTTISNDEEYCLLQLPPNDRIMISGLIRMFYALMNKSDSHRTAGMDMLQNLINSLYSTNDPTRLRMVITER